MSVVVRAREVLDRLEREGRSSNGLETLPLFAAFAEEAAPDPAANSAVAKAVAELEIDHMSPREALDTLYRLKTLL